MKNKLFIAYLLGWLVIWHSYAVSVPKTTNSPIHTLVDSESVVVSGDTLVNSVVGIAIPKQVDGASVIKWPVSCSGTIIGEDRKWVITAGHCVADTLASFGNFLSILNDHPLFIVPWQKGGIPPEIYNTHVDTTERYKVRAIYLPHDYNYANDGWTVPTLPYPFYIKQDFALLELEKPLPAKYKPIELNKEDPSRDKVIWLAGYGGNPVGMPEKLLLRYSQVYNIGNTFGSPATNYGQIYTLGSRIKPVYDDSGKVAYSEACSITQAGDDGAPVLYWDAASQKYLLVATFSRGMYVHSPNSFCAEIPKPYTANASIASNYDLITSIINDRALPMASKCLSLSDGCHNSFIYVTNTISGTLSGLKKSKISGDLLTMGAAATGFYRPIMTLLSSDILTNSKNKFLLVLHEGLNNEAYISSYHVDSVKGTLNNSDTIKIKVSPVAMTFNSSRDYLLVINKARYENSSISLFKFNSSFGTLTLRETILLPDDANPSSIVVSADNTVYITSITDDKIYIYKLYSSGILEPLSVISGDSIIKAGESPSQIKLDPDGVFAVVVNSGDSTISTYKIEKFGIERPIGSLSLISTIKSRIGNPDKILIRNDYVYISSKENRGIEVYLLNHPSGLLANMPTFTTSGNILDMDIDKAGTSLYATLEGQNKIVRYRRDFETGLLHGVAASYLVGYYPANITLHE